MASMATLALLLLVCTKAMSSAITNATDGSSFSSGRSKGGGVVNVKVFHFIIPHWGESTKGPQVCQKMPHLTCDWAYSADVKHLKTAINATVSNSSYSKVDTVLFAVYNIHSLWERFRVHTPVTAACELRTDLSLAESEESFVRYNHLFNPSFHYFDGNSTTLPTASLQRIYKEAILNVTDKFLEPRNFSSLIKGASYVASDCHKRDSANANRDWYVQQLRGAGLRVDGLARCMRSATGPEGVSLPQTHNTRYNLFLKREAIGKFLFNLAFENSIEDGYVTEKPFDALVSGTVPIYMGDTKMLKSLLPHPKAAIFLSDFNFNFTAIVQYLLYLQSNESAYEEHRSWRQSYTVEGLVADKPLMQNTWYCHLCNWAFRKHRALLAGRRNSTFVALQESCPVPK